MDSSAQRPGGSSVPSGPAAEPGEGAELRKPHEMIVLLPRARRITLTGRRLYNALLQVAQARLVAMASMPSADFMFEAPLPALLRSSGASSEDRTAAKRYLREMRGLEVDWESTAPGDGVKWRGFSMLSEVSIALRHGENWVSWSYPPTLMAALKEPTRWARIDLDILARLGTYAAVALYEICARYRDNPSGLTSRKPVVWWADALSPAPNGSERREWRKFKSERVREAIDEINRETDLDIELLEHKQGRAVVEAQFAVRRKRTAARSVSRVGSPVDAHLVLRAESLGIREAKLEGLISEFGEAAVRSKVDLLERRSANPRLPGLDNRYAYLRAVLRHDATASSQEAPELADANNTGDTSNNTKGPSTTTDAHIGNAQPPGHNGPAAAEPAPAGPVAGRLPPAHPHLAAMHPPAQGQARPATNPRAEASTTNTSDAGQASAQELWLAARIAQIKAEISLLDPAQRQAWVAQALAELAHKGLLSAVISRRAAQGDVLHGMLGSVIARLYALHHHGPGWDRAPAHAPPATLPPGS